MSSTCTASSTPAPLAHAATLYTAINLHSGSFAYSPLSLAMAFIAPWDMAPWDMAPWDMAPLRHAIASQTAIFIG